MIILVELVDLDGFKCNLYFEIRLEFMVGLYDHIIHSNKVIF
jgi:hypothetical protein